MIVGQILFSLQDKVYNDGERQLGICVVVDTGDGEVSIETENNDRGGSATDWRVAVPYGHIDELIDLLNQAKSAYESKLRGE